MASLATIGDVCAQKDDFNDGDDAGWTRYDPTCSNCPVRCPQNTFGFPNGAYRLQAATTPDCLVGPARAASLRQDVIYTNFYVTVDVVNWDDTVDQVFGIVAGVREVGVFSIDGYAFTYRVGRQAAFLTRFTNENPTGGGLGNSVSFGMSKDRTYRFVFQRVGEELFGDVYQLPDLKTPVMSVRASDITYPSGFCGLLVNDYSGRSGPSADASFDNYCAVKEAPARLCFSPPNSSLEAKLYWPASFAGYILESAPDLCATNWTREDHWFDNGTNYFTADTGSGMRFYRLRTEQAPAAQ